MMQVHITSATTIENILKWNQILCLCYLERRRTWLLIGRKVITDVSVHAVIKVLAKEQSKLLVELVS